jgi:MFS family permease
METEKQADIPELAIVDISLINAAPSIEHLKEHLIRHGLEMGDEEHIRWEKTNRKHPRNWSSWRKTYDFGLLIFLDFFTTVISTAGAPASSQASIEFGLGQTLSIFMFISTYMIAQAIGGVFFPPYSESFGRKKIFILATGLYCVFSIIIATVSHPAAIVIGRFVTGLSSALPTIVIAGSAEDIFDTGMRIWMIYAWAVAANVGICVGPIFGIFVTASLGW